MKNSKPLWFLLAALPCLLSAQSQKFSYLGFSLGMSDTELTTLSQKHPDLLLEKDMLLQQMIPSTPFTLALIGKDANIKKVFVDTYEKKSYQITVFFNPLYFSYYTLSESLMNKYGSPETRSSFKTTWYNQDRTKRLTLELPATVKITDYTALQRVIEFQNQQIEKGVSESVDYRNRQRLLDEL